ncbi:F-box/FBD/LRR-repeat protein At1g13570-like isoform X2 [Tasmannia lanceolata]|uniref:F-box/FBD/LRR-repeat protein At1g13570-like isoform X2 n=2 Tax=Tasmannia lanceolata TaxID=3420 RepID=UPI004063F868
MNQIMNQVMNQIRTSDSWTLHVLKFYIMFSCIIQGIKEIILDFSSWDRYKLPSSLFSCQEMYSLRLNNCIFNLPSTFKGFSCLKILYLRDVNFSNDGLEFLISNSPLLESLTFLDNYLSNHLKINAPKLQYLHLGARFNVFSLENTPLLASASIFSTFSNQFKPVETCSFTKLLSCLRNVKKLELGNNFLKVFASADVPHRVPYTFDHLKELFLDIIFEDPKQILAAFCLLRSSHNLQKLLIQDPRVENRTAPVTNKWNAQHYMDCKFNHLRTVEMSDVWGGKPELDFIELLLVNTPVLETFKISVLGDNGETKILTDLLGFRRASSQARIICDKKLQILIDEESSP